MATEKIVEAASLSQIWFGRYLLSIFITAKLPAMLNAPKYHKTASYLWILFISVALLCAQGVKLHLHNLDHDHGSKHLSSIDDAKHSHMSVAHLATDTSHIDHHNEVVTEIDASPDGLIKKGISDIPEHALIAFVFSALLIGFYRSTIHRRRCSHTKVPWRYHISPPLRAPPL